MITIKKYVLKIQYLKGKKSLIGQHAKKNISELKTGFKKLCKLKHKL